MIRQVHATDDSKTGLDTQNIYVENFRPNLVIHPRTQPSHAHIEDHFGEFQFTVYCPPHVYTEKSTHHEDCRTVTQSFTLCSTGPCARCMMVNINHTHGTLENTIVYDVLQAYRKQEGASVVFGQFLTYSNNDDGGIGELNDMVHKALHSSNIWQLPRLVVGGGVTGTNRK